MCIQTWGVSWGQAVLMALCMQSVDSAVTRPVLALEKIRLILCCRKRKFWGNLLETVEGRNSGLLNENYLLCVRLFVAAEQKSNTNTQQTLDQLLWTSVMSGVWVCVCVFCTCVQVCLEACAVCLYPTLRVIKGSLNVWQPHRPQGRRGWLLRAWNTELWYTHVSSSPSAPIVMTCLSAQGN